jgi:hypothetical protein
MLDDSQMQQSFSPFKELIFARFKFNWNLAACPLVLDFFFFLKTEELNE